MENSGSKVVHQIWAGITIVKDFCVLCAPTVCDFFSLKRSSLWKKINAEFSDQPAAKRVPSYCWRHGYDGVIIERRNGTALVVPDLKNTEILP